MDFAYAQSVHGEQQENRTVADVCFPIRFRASQEPLYICPTRTEGELFMLINAWSANRIGDSGLRPSHLLAIAEEHTKIVGYAADSRASPAFLAEKDKESFHVCDPERAELFLFRVLENFFK